MEKVIRIVRHGNDDSNLKYWRTLSGQQRIAELEKMRAEVHKRNGVTSGFQRVYRVVERAWG